MLNFLQAKDFLNLWDPLLFGPSSSSLNRTVPLTVKNENIFYWSIVFYIRSKVLCNRDTSYQVWIAVSLSESLNQLDLNLLNPSWLSTSVRICSTYFLLEDFTIVWSLFLLMLWHDSIFSSQISAPICCKTLHTYSSRSLCTIDLGMHIISA